MKQTILVTGGAGFIGSNFVHYVLENDTDAQIIVLDKFTYAGNPENLDQWKDDSRLRIVSGDICDKAVVEPLVKECDSIMHFAAESHVDRSISGPEEFVRTNSHGTFVLLEAARTNGNKRFHHVSTDEVFGTLNPTDPPFTEDSPHKPRSPYSATKACSDHLVESYYATYGLPVTISNCSNNYGPYHFPEKLIPLAITNLLEDKPVPVYGDGSQIRDWLYVEDHCSAVYMILEKGTPGERYCIGGDNQPTNLDVIKMLVRLVGKDESLIEFVKDRPAHDFRYDLDYSKLQKQLGWKPSVTLEEGLKRTVEWYKDNEDWWKRVKSGEYKDYYKKQYEQK